MSQNQEIEANDIRPSGKRKLRRAFDAIWTLPRIVGLVLLLLGLAGMFDGPVPYLPIPGLSHFHRALSPELVGIGLTVLIVDYANELRQNQQLKSSLIRDLGSQSNEFALRALREIKHHDWHRDGSLKKAQLATANLESALLHHSDLEGAFLMWSNLRNADLRHANLSGANLLDADMFCARLTGAILERATLVGCELMESEIMTTNLGGAKLAGVNLIGSNLFKANLKAADLSGADLSGAKLMAADLSGANLTSALLFGTDLSEANLQGATLTDAMFTGATLHKTDLRGAIGVSEDQFSSVETLLDARMPGPLSDEEWQQRIVRVEPITIVQPENDEPPSSKFNFLLPATTLIVAGIILAPKLLRRIQGKLTTIFEQSKGNNDE